jgi:tripeptide aminopeptidase
MVKPSWRTVNLLFEVGMTQRESLLDRFIRYTKIDTQSDGSSESFPSTEKQKDLLRLLVDELKGAGLDDAAMDQWGYVTATLPSNIPTDHHAYDKVPAIGFLAHVDTYHEVPGGNVDPQVHKDYNGGDITYPDNPDLVLSPEEAPPLKGCIGETIITAGGKTLLGADNKAGIAEIMEALHQFKENPDRLHGPIKVAFIPDEEVGKGTNHFDVEAFGANFAYTLDGSEPGSIEDESFCADSAIVTCKGADVHPGYAKDKMINAMRLAGNLISSLPADRRPETTEGREGYLHPISIEGNVSQIKVHFLVRDFAVEGLQELENILKDAAKKVEQSRPGSKIEIEIKEAYRNMKYALDKDKRVTDYAMEAVKRAGLEPKLQAIRGGTDGARLSFMGLPTPNIFCGEMNFHSLKEWTCLSWMEKAVEVIGYICDVWLEKSS